MACKPNPFLLAFLLILSIVAEARHAPAPAAAADRKQPQWLIDPNDGSMLIPGIGRIMLPPLLSGHGHGGPVASGTGRGFVPGGDDTYVPNPGVEIPPVPVSGP